MCRVDPPGRECGAGSCGLFVGLLVAAVPSLAAGPHTAIDLHVPGYSATTASSVAAGRQVGALDPTLTSAAVLWSGSAASAINLHPSGYRTSVATGISPDGSRQVGWATTDDAVHAALWSSSAESFIDLNPPGYLHSYARATDGVVQVGIGATHALLWRGSAQSVVDLHPSGATYSDAWDVAGGQQVGFAIFGGAVGPEHAMLWSGDAASALDLHPAGFTRSIAAATSGTRQVGYGRPASTNDDHALLWSGSAGSVLDLHPTGLGLTQSFATGIAGDYIVGYGSGPGTGFRNHALLWTSPHPSSAIDLHPLLGVAEPARSFAGDVDEQGNVAGFADVAPSVHAFLWAVPEPAALPWIAFAVVWLGRRHPHSGRASAGGRI